MLNTNKCEHEIVRNILQYLSVEGRSQNYIMFKVGLNSKQVHIYRDFLLNKEMIELKPTTAKRVHWHITFKGEEVLMLLNTMSAYFDEKATV